MSGFVPARVQQIKAYDYQLGKNEKPSDVLAAFGQPWWRYGELVGANAHKACTLRGVPEGFPATFVELEEDEPLHIPAHWPDPSGVGALGTVWQPPDPSLPAAFLQAYQALLASGVAPPPTLGVGDVPTLLNAAEQWWYQQSGGGPAPDTTTAAPFLQAAIQFVSNLPAGMSAATKQIPWTAIPWQSIPWDKIPWQSIDWGMVANALGKLPPAGNALPVIQWAGGNIDWPSFVKLIPWDKIPWTLIPFDKIPWDKLAALGGAALASTQAIIQNSTAIANGQQPPIQGNAPPPTGQPPISVPAVPFVPAAWTFVQGPGTTCGLYAVQKGDTLLGIAKTYGIGLPELLAAPRTAVDGSTMATYGTLVTSTDITQNTSLIGGDILNMPKAACDAAKALLTKQNQPPPKTTTTAASSSSSMWGWALAALGAVGLAVGGYYAFAKKKPTRGAAAAA